MILKQILSLLVILFCSFACSIDVDNAPVSRLKLSHQEIQFGESAVLKAVTVTLQVINTGNQPVAISAVKIEQESSVYSVENKSITLNPNDKLEIPLTFTPLQPIEYPATLIIQMRIGEKVEVPIHGKGLLLDACGNCDIPPDSKCISENQSEVYADQGDCINQGGTFTCSYSSSIVNCPAGCDDTLGKCKSGACGSAVCNTPPNQECYKSEGTCTNNLCSYEPDNGKSCGGKSRCSSKPGICENGVCVGSQTVCDDPPKAFCSDENHSQIYNIVGVCRLQGCEYISQIIECPNGCDQLTGFCSGDPCYRVECNVPPVEGCFSVPGTCLNGACDFPFIDNASCDDKDPCTENDLCANKSCNGTPKACATPPEAQCVNAKTVKMYEPQGTCEKTTGECKYVEKTQNCDFGCEDGVCNDDPCLTMVCNTPNAPSVCYTTPGTCQNGECIYAYNNQVDCDDGNPCTSNDSCNTGMCSGVIKTCDQPPANACADNDTKRIYASSGVCSPSTDCEYSYTDTNCAAGEVCVSGNCVNANTCYEIQPFSASSADAKADTPKVVADGNNFYLIWKDRRNKTSYNDLYMNRVDISGVALTNDILLTDSDAKSYDPQIVIGNGGIAYTWDDSRTSLNSEIYFNFVDFNGVRAGNDKRVTNASGSSWYPSIAYNPVTGGYGITWMDSRDGNQEIYFAAVDNNGSTTITDINLTNNTSYSSRPQIVWNGSGYAIVFFDNRDGNNEIYFIKIGATGNILTAAKRITNDTVESTYPAMVWTGTEYGLAWIDRSLGTDEIFFVRLDTNGVIKGTATNISENDSFMSRYPSITFTGTQFGIVWQDSRNSSNIEIYMAKLSSTGTKIGTDIRLTTIDDSSTRPSITYTSKRYGITWVDYANTNSGIFFLTTCP